MKKVQFWAAAFGLASVLSLGTFAVLRAQQAESKAKAESVEAPNKALRDRIITLRTEVGLLELERDGIRAGLLKTLEGIEQGDLQGIDASAWMGFMHQELRAMQMMAGMAGDVTPEKLEALKKSPEKQKNDLRAAIERKKKEYAHTLRALNEKRFDLQDAEKRYSRVN